MADLGAGGEDTTFTVVAGTSGTPVWSTNALGHDSTFSRGSWVCLTSSNNNADPPNTKNNT